MDNNKIEQKENFSITAETISGDALRNIIDKYRDTSDEKRFLKSEDGGVFKYFHPDALYGNKTNKFYSIVKVNEKIIGLCLLGEDTYKEKTFGLGFLSIDPEYQGQGYASKLAEESFKFAKKEGYSILGTPYSDEGDKKLKPLFTKLADKFGVNYIDYKEGRMK